MKGSKKLRCFKGTCCDGSQGKFLIKTVCCNVSYWGISLVCSLLLYTWNFLGASTLQIWVHDHFGAWWCQFCTTDSENNEEWYEKQEGKMLYMLLQMWLKTLSNANVSLVTLLFSGSMWVVLPYGFSEALEIAQHNSQNCWGWFKFMPSHVGCFC